MPSRCYTEYIATIPNAQLFTGYLWTEAYSDEMHMTNSSSR